MKIKGAYRDMWFNLKNKANCDDVELSVTRGEYRFLLMEYTRMVIELAEYKEALEENKRKLYEALKGWEDFGFMKPEYKELLKELAEEFEPETEEEAEGSLEE